MACWVVSCGMGCARPIAPEGATAANVSEEELTVLWDAALAEIRRHGFQPDRQDRGAGLITTYPETGKQFGEFWRRDVVDDYSLLESTLHTTQRQVTVRFVKGEAWQVQVEVQKFRLSTAEAQVTNASSSFFAFSGNLPNTEGKFNADRRAGRHWTAMGRDGVMEERLLGKILDRAGSGGGF